MCALCRVAAVMVDMAGPSWKVKPVALQGRRNQEAAVVSMNQRHNV
jgi:hypothetical protein